MRKYFTICKRRQLVIYDFAPDPSEFPHIGVKFYFLFYQCTLYRRLDARMTSQPPCVLCDVTWRPENPEIWGPSLTSLQNLPIKVTVTYTFVNVDR
jgi:hypothetical protein